MESTDSLIISRETNQARRFKLMIYSLLGEHCLGVRMNRPQRDQRSSGYVYNYKWIYNRTMPPQASMRLIRNYLIKPFV